MGLGRLADVTLAEARERAAQARKLAHSGVDPLDARRAETAALEAARGLNTFREVAAAYIAAHTPGWRNAKHAAQWGSTLATYVYPSMGNLSVAAIGTGDVTRVLHPIWTTKPETAGRVRGRIEAILDYAAVRGWRTGENPARWRGHLAKLLPVRAKIRDVRHHAALPWTDVGAFMAALAGQPGMAALALRFTILTAARTGEVIGATWREVDLGGAVWTVRADRMKAAREHRVPLAAPAIDILQHLAGAGTDPTAFVFPGLKAGNGLSNMAMLALLRRMGRGDLTAHGFRSTFRDWAAETTAYPAEVAEAALAHVAGGKVVQAYKRGDLFAKRARLMGEWAAYCCRQTTRSGEVVPIRSNG